jgi:class 3 adenylate cyclase/PAS domain-containing protein
MARLQDVTVQDHPPSGADVQLQVALDHLPGALVYTDKDLNIVICNDRFKEMYRVPEELLQPGRPYPDFLRYLAEHGYYGEGDVDALVAQRVDSLRNPSAKSFEDHAPDGRWYRIVRRRVAGGGTVTVMTDITEQKQTEQDLAKKEAQFRVALGNMPGALVYTDNDLNIVFCNDRFKEMYDAPRDLLQPGRPYPEFLRYLAANGYYGEGDVDAQVAQRVDSLRNPSAKSFEDHAPDGRWYRIVRRRAAAGGAVTVMTDITEQKQAERILAEKEAQLHVALDNMPGALVYTDEDLNIAVCNERFKDMYGAPRELLQPGRFYPDFLRYLAVNGYYGAGDVDALVAERVESLRNPSGRSFEDHTPDGRWLRIRRRRVAAGGAVTVMTDITEQKKAERELVEAKQRTEEANKLVSEKNRILEGLYAELKDKNRQVEEQAAQLAEWNTTLESRVAEQVSQIGRYSRLTRFLSPKISDLIMSGETDDALKTRRAEITVVYVDLRGFTGFTETAEPEEVMSVLRQYHAELGRLVVEYDGTIEHIAGDGMMVLFNAPMPVENHELQAIRMALAMRQSLTALSSSWRKRGHELGFGAGIAGGYVTIGTIGFEQRLDYGAIGPACNLAARLCGEAKDTQVLIAPRVLSKVEAHIEVEPVGDLLLKGFQRPVSAHNILGISRAGLGQFASTNHASASATSTVEQSL